MILTIGLPVFNDREALEETINSIAPSLGKLKGLVEVVVSDNSSSDASYQAATPLASNFSDVFVHTQPKNLGFAGNLKFIATQARGQYVWFLGAGDTLQPGILNEVVELLAEAKYDWGTVRALFNYHNFQAYTEPDQLVVTASSLEKNNVAVCNHAISMNIMRTEIMSGFLSCSAHGAEIGVELNGGPTAGLMAWMDETCYWPHLEALFSYVSQRSDSVFTWFEFHKLSVLLNDNKNGNWDKGLAAMKIFAQWSQVVSYGAQALPLSSWLKDLKAELRGAHLLRFVFMVTKDGNIAREDIVSTLNSMRLEAMTRLIAGMIIRLPKIAVSVLVWCRLTITKIIGVLKKA